MGERLAPRIHLLVHVSSLPHPLCRAIASKSLQLTLGGGGQDGKPGLLNHGES